MPRAYETLLIVKPDVPEEDLATWIEAKKTQLVEQGATDMELNIRGKKRLAYEIGGCKEGVYVQYNYESEPSAVTVLEKALRLDETVLRYMTITPVETEDAAE